MSFFRKQEIGFARKLIIWQYVHHKMPLPDKSVIDKRAEEVVEESRRIAKETGKSLFSVLKDAAAKVLR